MKGRIIGREGRNIRAFEKATGVDVIIDDTPGVVIVSAFDPGPPRNRPHLAQQADRRRPHPSLADRRARRRNAEGNRSADPAATAKRPCRKRKSAACNERVVNLLGRLHFRTSYSQNVLRHSIEVAFVAGMMAEEMGMDGDLARRAGLLHDIGKAADHETEGGHPQDRRRPAQALRRRTPKSSTPRSATTTTSAPTCPTRCSSPRPTPAARRARRPPRDARPLHQADGGAGIDRHRLPRRRAGVRHPGRPRGARHRQHPNDDRRIGRQDLPRHRQGVRGAADVSRRDQGHDDPRNADLPKRRSK